MPKVKLALVAGLPLAVCSGWLVSSLPHVDAAVESQSSWQFAPQLLCIKLGDLTVDVVEVAISKIPLLLNLAVVGPHGARPLESAL